MSKKIDLEYYFIEWIIIEKDVSAAAYDLLTTEEIKDLKKEFLEALKTATIINL